MRDDLAANTDAGAVRVRVDRSRLAADVVVVEDMHLAIAHARSTLRDGGEHVVGDRDLETPDIGRVAVGVTDQHRLVVAVEDVVGHAHVVAAARDVDGAVVALLGLAVLDRQGVIGYRRIGDRVAVDPDVLGAQDSDGVVGRVPVARGAVGGIEDGRNVARCDDLQVAHDDIGDADDVDASVDEPCPRVSTNQRGVRRQAHLGAQILIGLVGEGHAFAHVDGTDNLDDFRPRTAVGDCHEQLQPVRHCVDLVARSGRSAARAAYHRGPAIRGRDVAGGIGLSVRR